MEKKKDKHNYMTLKKQLQKAIRNKCHASSNRCLTSSNKKPTKNRTQVGSRTPKKAEEFFDSLGTSQEAITASAS